jgi:hypothetical protein
MVSDYATGFCGTAGSAPDMESASDQPDSFVKDITTCTIAIGSDHRLDAGRMRSAWRKKRLAKACKSPWLHLSIGSTPTIRFAKWGA